MRLKQIKLAGFKSFVDVTKIPFEQALTAIIGPNGCGKSNVIDAVRWVLGESSAKNLRGDSMTDVIFNGSGTRRPISVASVELNFENCAAKLTGQYASYQEISVKRQVSRDGDSQYFLNGQKCRRKDITDLFMGTGLGPRSYAIIEQGTISRLIESKPQDLRVFIEEAAGISRYKERRKETENRIRHTRENLERLNDIRVELGTQLEKLAQQAKSALTYREFKQTERDLHAKLLVVRYQELALNGQQIAQQLVSLELELAAINAKAQSCETELIRLQQVLAGLSEQEQQEVELFYQTKTEIAKCEQALQHKQAQDSQWQQQHDSLQVQLQEIHTQHQRAKVEQGELLSLQAELTHQGQAVYGQLALLDEQVSELDDSADELRQGINQANELAAGAKMALALSEAKLEHVSQNLSRDERQISALTQELATEQAQDSQHLLAPLEQALAQCKDKLALEEEVKIQLAHSLETQRDKVSELASEHQGVLHQATFASARLALIEEWLKGEDQQMDVKGIPLWQHVTVTPGWESAVELALQGILQSQVITPESVQSQADGHRPEASGFHQDDKYAFSHKALSASVNLAPWLGRLTWLETSAEAISHRETLTQEQCFITQDGYLVGQDFVLKGAVHKQSQLLLSNEKYQLEADIEQFNRKLIILTEDVSQAKAQLEQLQLQASLCQQTCHGLQLEQNKLTSSIASITEQQQDKARRIAQSRQALSLLSVQYEEMQLQQQALWELIASQEKTQQEAQREKDKRNQDWQLVHGQLTSLKAARTEQDRLKVEHERDLQNMLTALALKEQEINQQTSQQQALSLNLAQLSLSSQQQDDGAQDAIEQLQQRLGRHLSAQTEQQGRLTTTRTQQAQVQVQIDELVLMQKQQLGVTEGLTQKIGELKLRREGLKGQGDAQQQLLEEHQVDLNAVASQLTLGITAPQLSADLESLRAKIALLGAINLAAIEEYEVQRERKAYLDDQDDDLNKGLLILEDAIRKIDRETRSRFKATFEAVNHDLGLLFPKVFGGGRAYLALTDDDLLETGVTIMAQPPGKKNSSIHLLSGGEKALTALSLVFAIFRLNPAPFCMLDEVDAPLDDANVERFCRLLEEMSQSVQFIYISHNKITMELADQLIGVTMHEPGVSRIVAVDIEQAVAMADAL